MSVLQVVSIKDVRGTPVLFQVPFVVSEVALSQCSSRAAILSTDGRIFSCIVEVPHSMRVVGFPAGVSFPIKHVSVSPAGRFFAAVDARGRLFVEDVDGQKAMTRVAAVDQVVRICLADQHLIALDVVGHIWTSDAGSSRARRLTEKTSVASRTIAASSLHVLALGREDRAIRRLSFTEPDTGISPLLIPGVDGEVCMHAFPSSVSCGDDFLVTTGDSRVFWLKVKLERFVLKPLDLPENFRFREAHVALAGVFFVGERGQMHRLDWEVIKETTATITSEMLIPFSVAPVPALLRNQTDVRPEKVAFGLVHALFLWVENDPDRTGELKGIMSEISAVLQETHELKKKIACSLPAPSIVELSLGNRERLLRDALVRELAEEKRARGLQDDVRELYTELKALVETKLTASDEKVELENQLQLLRPEISRMLAEAESLRTLRDSLVADVENLKPVVKELRAKLYETSDTQRVEQLKRHMSEIDSRLLLVASELKAKKLVLGELATERAALMRQFREYSINTD